MMQPFACSCVHDGSERCVEHAALGCHNTDADPTPEPVECPPCRLARRRSIVLSHRATPTKSWAL